MPVYHRHKLWDDNSLWYTQKNVFSTPFKYEWKTRVEPLFDPDKSGLLTGPPF